MRSSSAISSETRAPWGAGSALEEARAQNWTSRLWAWRKTASTPACARYRRGSCICHISRKRRRVEGLSMSGLRRILRSPDIDSPSTRRLFLLIWQIHEPRRYLAHAGVLAVFRHAHNLDVQFCARASSKAEPAPHGALVSEEIALELLIHY